MISILVLVVIGLPAQDEGMELRRGFRSLQLGMEFTETQEALADDLAFFYRGPADVSLRPSDGQNVIDSAGRGFVERGLFQFHDGRLYTIAIYLDHTQLDYFQLYEQLNGRYGDPLELDPRRAIWEDDQTRIELERPLTIRFLDMETFIRRRTERRQLDSAAMMSRDSFLSEF